MKQFFQIKNISLSYLKQRQRPARVLNRNLVIMSKQEIFGQGSNSTNPVWFQRAGRLPLTHNGGMYVQATRRNPANNPHLNTTT